MRWAAAGLWDRRRSDRRAVGIAVKSWLAALGLCVMWAGCADAQWSAPMQLPGCSSERPPLVVFPASYTDALSGPGALLWSSGESCGQPPSTFLYPLGSDDLPLSARSISLTGIAAATGTTKGQILLAGSGSKTSDELLEGTATGPISTVGVQDGQSAPLVATSAILGDAAVVSVAHTSGGPVIALQSQRHYLTRPTAPVLLTPSTGAVGALAVNLDFRGEAIVAWASGGTIYAREVAQTGKAGPLQKLGSGSASQLQALISDDGHAMVAWETQQAPSGTSPSTSIRLSISAAGVRFGRSRLVENFHDPNGQAPAPGSLRLLRLSTENVLMAWSGQSSGRYAVYAAPISLAAGVLSRTIISDPDQQSMLSDLVGGPDGEALALWSSSPQTSGGIPGTRQQILAAMGRYVPPREAVFGPIESVASSGPNGPVMAAIDPGDGRALAAWVQRTEHPRVAYAVRASNDPVLASGAAAVLELTPTALSMLAPTGDLDTSW